MWELAFQLKEAFPSYLERDITRIIEGTRVTSPFKMHPKKTFRVFFNNEKIEIPIRHSLNEIQQASFLKRVLVKKLFLLIFSKIL